jgi:hypothetical protein
MGHHSRGYPVAGDKEQAEEKIVGLFAGLSILRYISAEDSAKPPTVRVRPLSAGHQIDFVPVPGEAEHMLRAPGAAIVLVAEAATQLAITTLPRPQSKSATVDLHLELVADALRSDGREPLGNDIDRLIPTVPTPAQLSVLGHVARQGDVLVASGEWLGGPEFPARIEGLEIRWSNMPRNIELEYSVAIAGSIPIKLRSCRVSEFAGTRGQSAAIVQLKIVLRSYGANSYQIRADCVFLGGQIISESGQVLSLSGPTGTEPLVGLRLWIECWPG